MKPKRIVLIYSGGLDSTVLLHHLRDQGYEVYCLTVNYGQRHGHEISHAIEMCDVFGVQHHVLHLPALAGLLYGSSQTSSGVPVPEGHYTAESMKATVVPNRNMVLLSLAIGWAIATGSDAVAYAAHNGDHAIYHDCREEFAQAMGMAAALCDERPIQLLRPFVERSKADIVSLGDALGVPFEATWSCYKGGELHCGKCGTCVERREAFALAGVADPTEYEPPVLAAGEVEASGVEEAQDG